MLPVLPPIVARACAHGTRTAILDRKGALHLRAARSRICPSCGAAARRPRRSATRPASRFSSLPDSTTWPCNGASGAPAASPSRCRCRILRPSSTTSIRDSEASIVIADADNAPRRRAARERPASATFSRRAKRSQAASHRRRGRRPRLRSARTHELLRSRAHDRLYQRHDRPPEGRGHDPRESHRAN